MFELEVNYARLKLNRQFENKIKKWLGNDEKYLAQVYRQKIIRLYNNYYHDEMIYNGLRGKRPQNNIQLNPEKNYTFNLLRDSLENCDFCENSYRKFTATDIFGRIETKLSYTAANTFKYDKWHSLIVSRNHNTLNLTEEETIDMFSLSVKWFKRVNKEDKSAIFPELIWDAMPKSGASQVHTHFQASVGLIGYYGVMRRWIDASSQYFNENQRSFLQDFIFIHKALGLVYEFEKVVVIVNLVSLKIKFKLEFFDFCHPYFHATLLLFSNITF